MWVWIPAHLKNLDGNNDEPFDGRKANENIKVSQIGQVT